VKQSKIEKRENIKVTQAHSDEVVTIPSFMKILASSESCKHEILLSENKRFLTFQGHPEYTPDFYYFRIYKTMMLDGDAGSYNESKESFLKNYKYKGDTEYELRSLIYTFLKL